LYIKLEGTGMTFTGLRDLYFHQDHNLLLFYDAADEKMRKDTEF